MKYSSLLPLQSNKSIKQEVWFTDKKFNFFEIPHLFRTSEAKVSHTIKRF